MKTPRSWKINLTMTLGAEKLTILRTVNLDGDVKETLASMTQAKSDACGAINNAYDSILSTASKEFSARIGSEKRKK